MNINRQLRFKLLQDNERSCTDLYCLVCYCLLTALCMGVGVYSLAVGYPLRALVPYDSSGNACGLELNIYPYLYYVYPGGSSVRVCLKECPRLNDKIECWTNSYVQSCQQSMDQDVQKRVLIYPSVANQFFHLCLPEDSKLAGNILPILEDRQKGLFISKTVILWAIAIAFFLCILLIFLVKWFLRGIIFISLLGFLFICIFCSIILLKAAPYISDSTIAIEESGAGNYVFAGLLIAAAALSILFIIQKRQKINLMEGLTDVSIQFLNDVKSCAIVPLIQFLGILIFFLFWLGLQFCIYSVGDQISESGKWPFFYPQHSVLVKWMLIVNVVYLFWTIFILIDLGDFLIMGAAVQWYFSEDQFLFSMSLLVSAKRLFRYHLGTVCVGSLLAIVLAIPNFITKLFLNLVIECNKCWWGCCLPCMKMRQIYSSQSYAAVNISGEGYFNSSLIANSAFENSALSKAVSGLSFTFKISATFFVVFFSCLYTYLMLTYSQIYSVMLDDTLLIVSVVACLSTAIGLFGVGIFSSASEAVLTTYLVQEQVQGKQGPDVLGRFINQAYGYLGKGPRSCQ